MNFSSFIKFTVTERFLRYVTIDTQSDPSSVSFPSTEKQKDLGRLLVDELLAMGVTDAHLDEFGYVYATIPSNTDKKVPVRELKFFYLRDFGSLKKIEAIYAEQNMLYASTRTMTMDFDDLNGAASLTGYRLEGVQKMALSDSVYFSIHASVGR